MRNEEEKEKNKTLKQEKSKEKLRLKEGAIESVRKIGGAIKKTAQFVAAPFKGFFDKILEFITLLGLGIGANAVFKWFEDEENRKKMSKFFNIIVSNWKLIRNILGVIAGGVILGKLASIAMIVGKVLAILANPLFLAGVGIAIAAADKSLGGDLTDVLKEVKDAGDGKVTRENLNASLKKREKYLKDPKFEGFAGFTNATERQRVQREIVFLKTGFYGGLGQEKSSGAPKPINWDLLIEASKAGDVGIDFFGNMTVEPQGREKGGPVSAKTPYLVGEAGPEIFAPNVDGSIINNMRTEKIYQMISSKDAGKINFITMELPPKVIKKEQQDSTQQTAPPVPSISPVNGSNPYMNTTPEIYGIYV
ncbi:MAG TPA: hypothetical protein DCX27_06305 [Balneola sp.]|nr:hypothetical protein [Balneola sp.]